LAYSLVIHIRLPETQPNCLGSVYKIFIVCVFQHYHVENAQIIHFQEEIAKRDTEIVMLKETAQKFEVSVHNISINS